MTNHETVADVLADMRHPFFKEQAGRFADRIERAMAASAVPVASSFDREHAADIVSHLVNSHTSAWIAGEKVSAAVAAHSRQYCKQAMVEAANLLEQLISAPPAVPVESLGRDAPDPVPLNAVRAALEAVDTGRTQIARDNLRILEIHLRAQSAPPPASVPDALRAVASHLRGEDLAEGLPEGWEKLADHEEVRITLNVRTIRAVIDATTPEPRT